MKRILFICLAAVLIFAAIGYSTVRLTEINYSNVNAGDFDQSLRRWISTLNQDIANGGSLFNVGTGKIFYVDSDDGSSAFTGLSADRAKATLDQAINLCEDSRGDIIYVLQGHSKAMGAAADEVDIDVDGVTIIGLGNGTDRPIFDYTDDVSGAFVIDADNVVLDNFIFNANILEVNEGILITAGSTDWAITNCSFTVTAAGTDEFLSCIDSEGAASDRGLISGCIFRQGAGNSAISALHMLDIDGLVFRGNVVQGTYTTACIFAETNASTDVLITDNVFSDPGVDTLNLVASSTGFVARNIVAMEATVAASLDIGNCWNVGNKLILDDDVTGALSDAVTSAYTSNAASAE